MYNLLEPSTLSIRLFFYYLDYFNFIQTNYTKISVYLRWIKNSNIPIHHNIILLTSFPKAKTTPKTFALNDFEMVFLLYSTILKYTFEVIL